MAYCLTESFMVIKERFFEELFVIFHNSCTFAEAKILCTRCGIFQNKLCVFRSFMRTLSCSPGRSSPSFQMLVMNPFFGKL